MTKPRQKPKTERSSAEDRSQRSRLEDRGARLLGLSRLRRLHRLGKGPARPAFELKPSTATISLRLPEGMLDELKILANERDVPYQSLLKVFLAERIRQERVRRRRSA